MGRLAIKFAKAWICLGDISWAVKAAASLDFFTKSCKPGKQSELMIAKSTLFSSKE
jgi:hypothetical protein